MKNNLHEASEIWGPLELQWQGPGRGTELERDEDIFPEGQSQAVAVHLLDSEFLIFSG